jgi:TonB family protein
MKQPKARERGRTVLSFMLSLLLHLAVVLLFWVSAEHIFYTPPAKQHKKITLDLSHFVPPAPPPRPQARPTPPPRPVVPPPTPTPKPKPKPIVKPKPKPIPKPVAKQEQVQKPEPTRKTLAKKKTLVAKKAAQENNATKAVKKPPKKIVKKKKPKKPKKKIVKKKKTPQKKVVKKKIAKKQPKKIHKQKKRVVKKSRPSKKRIARKSQPKHYRSSLANSLMGGKRSASRQPVRSRRASSGNTQRMIKQLYGKQYNSFSPEQKKFIKNNLAIIHRITQMTLIRNGYPEVAARTGQQGINIVSFYLHPNGNITKLRLEKPMGYEALDKNTLQVIRIAYKDYPLPTKTTKIIFYVQYSIDGY